MNDYQEIGISWGLDITESNRKLVVFIIGMEHVLWF